MKGFGIEIKNDLLDPKHLDKMGVAVWLYMWYIDKMTSVTEESIGYVLGRKPITYEKDIKPELGITERTYNRWVQTLKKEGYINVTRTPYGLSTTVNKAFKHFGKRTATNGVSEPPEVADQNTKSGGSNTITTSVDKTVDKGWEEFWKLYPRKVEKKKAQKAWIKLKPNESTIKQILAGLAAQMKTEQWKKDDGKFIPHPTTWLNGARWEDEMPKDEPVRVAVPESRPQPQARVASPEGLKTIAEIRKKLGGKFSM